MADQAPRAARPRPIPQPPADRQAATQHDYCAYWRVAAREHLSKRHVRLRVRGAALRDMYCGSWRPSAGVAGTCETLRGTTIPTRGGCRCACPSMQIAAVAMVAMYIHAPRARARDRGTAPGCRRTPQLTAPTGRPHSTHTPAARAMLPPISFTVLRHTARKAECSLSHQHAAAPLPCPRGPRVEVVCQRPERLLFAQYICNQAMHPMRCRASNQKPPTSN